MNDILRTVREALRHVNGPLIAGVSGGADSVALLCLLHELRREVTVVTCDFHLRGDESTHDRAFTAHLCRSLGIECIEADMDVPGYIASHGGSVEMACRQLRYDLFRRLMKERGAVRIAVAHNMDDNIETLFLNLMRGAGTEGLKGMIPDTGEIIRPLLNVSRREIEEYLERRGQSYRIDSTNLEDTYRRNFIRHHVLPLLESRWPEARKSIATTQRNLRGEAAVIRKAVTPACGNLLTWTEIAESGDAATAIRRFTCALSPSASQVAEMTKVATHRLPGRIWRIHDTEIHSERDGLHIVTTADTPIPPYHCVRIRNTRQAQKMMRRMRDQRICWLPQDSHFYNMRHPVAADRIEPLGMRGSSLVSDVLKDARLSRDRRRHAVVMTDAGGHIIWIDGVKRSRHDLVDDTHTHIYLVSADRTILDEIVARLDMES